MTTHYRNKQNKKKQKNDKYTKYKLLFFARLFNIFLPIFLDIFFLFSSLVRLCHFFFASFLMYAFARCFICKSSIIEMNEEEYAMAQNKNVLSDIMRSFH